jgi:MSHA biogenesis protein MshN
MSVLNQVLRDLDARKAGDGARARLPSAVTPLSVHVERTRGNPGWWILLGAAVVLAALTATWFWRADSRASAPLPAAAPAAALPPAADVHASVTELPAIASPSPREKLDKSSPAQATASRVEQGAPSARAVRGLRQETTLHTAMPAPSVTEPQVVVPGTGNSRSLQPLPEVATGLIDKKTHQPTIAERAEAAYRQGVAQQQQGRFDEALGSYRGALELQADHAAARQAAATLLIQMRRLDEAEIVLTEGLNRPQTALPSLLSLGRLKVELGASQAALDLLLGHRELGERSAEYQGFLATLLNRAGRHAQAVEHYQQATRLAPGEARWWAGLGIALDAQGQGALARDAYLRARALPNLPEELASHIEQRLR